MLSVSLHSLTALSARPTCRPVRGRPMLVHSITTTSRFIFSHLAGPGGRNPSIVEHTSCQHVRIEINNAWQASGVSRVGLEGGFRTSQMMRVGASNGVTPLIKKQHGRGGGRFPGNQKTPLDTPLQAEYTDLEWGYQILGHAMFIQGLFDLARRARRLVYSTKARLTAAVSVCLVTSPAPVCAHSSRKSTRRTENSTQSRQPEFTLCKF